MSVCWSSVLAEIGRGEFGREIIQMVDQQPLRCRQPLMSFWGELHSCIREMKPVVRCHETCTQYDKADFFEADRCDEADVEGA